jgi:5-methyltetrahydrofolate--homocysteine methyltransferase
VKGDVHDIGKNIVRSLLANYGFRVIDLGRDVAPERIVECAKENDAFMVGLSALMTTTVPSMKDTISLLRKSQFAGKVVVGGAVVTQQYADEIGADFYAPDAMAAVRIAKTIS